MIDLDKHLKPGKKIRYMAGIKHHAELRHIRVVFTDEGVEMIVYRVWGHRKRRWFYHVMPRISFELEDEAGRLSL
jgi:hypothetical protein